MDLSCFEEQSCVYISDIYTVSRVLLLLVCLTEITSPARLGLPPMEEVAELSELMEEALGLFFRVDLLRELLALVGVVQGKPIRVTLWTGANRPYLGMHWKYLRGEQLVQEKLLCTFVSDC